MYFMYNLEVILLIGFAKSYNYKYKMSKKLTKKPVPTICLLAFVESTIMYNQWSIIL